MEITNLPEELRITPITEREKYCWEVSKLLNLELIINLINREHCMEISHNIDIIKVLTELKNELMPMGVGEYNYPKQKKALNN
jgi:hypothetical protein